ncbi:RNA polymerase sigma factor [Chitinophaga sp. 22321]|uniref:Sigma-70 family RNA polymerase sigma factor n=1 Tax=Chitinophaga hostae TaxID=2831022 RepID=A0ABS5IYX8_9BACT|nr:sigma-70 family RNA polymerase sigma factor [Chitinophaga hostae]
MSTLHDYQNTNQSLKERESSFAVIYNKYYPELYFMSRRFVGDQAPDILAEVFIRFWNRQRQFDNEFHLISYLRVMVHNACIDYLKMQQRQLQSLQDFSYLSDQEYEDHYFREVMEGRLFSLIMEEIERLPEHCKIVFKMSYIDGLRNAEIARLLNIKDASVRVRKSEALRILRSVRFPICLLLLVVAYRG